MVTGDPFLLQLAVYVGLHDRLAVAKPGDELQIVLTTCSDGLKVTFGGPHREEISAARTEVLDEMAAVCTGKWSEETAPDGVVLTITVPAQT
jgi:hypothetical protein